MLVQVFGNILLMSAVGGLLAFFLLCIKPVTGKLFTPCRNYYIWLTVLVVMVLPVRINLLYKAPVAPITITVDTQSVQTDSEVQTQAAVQPLTRQPNYPQKQVLPKAGLHYSVFFCLNLIWVAVALLLLGAKLLKYCVFLRTLHRNSIPDTSLSQLPERIRVFRTDVLDAPLLIGLFRPMLFLPSNNLSAEEMSLILAHELTHYKRNDIAYKWFAMLVQAIHWFNPLVYAVSRQIDSECEVSCDIAVTSRLTEDEQSRYMNTILLLAANSRSRLRPLTIQMANGKKILQRKFSMIKRKTIFKKKTIIISAVLAVAILTTAVIASGISGNALFKDFSGGVDALNTDKITGGAFNLLFIGLDNGGRADSIMLTAVKNDGIRVVSIPMNTIFQNKRISDILKAENGEQAAIAAIKQTLSVPIHYYVKTDLNAVKKIVDSMDGVEFDVPTDMVYDDPHQNLHINLKKGTQFLDGEKACHLLQYRRGYTEGDITRIQMQQQFLKELIRQRFSKEGVENAAEIIRSVSGNIQTNYPQNNLKAVGIILSAIKENNISFETIPGKLVLYNEMPMYEIEQGDAEKNIINSLSSGL